MIKIEPININNFIEALDYVTKVLSNSNVEETLRKKELSNIDGKLQDLYHEAEFSTLSRREKLSLVNSIMLERQNRRKVKNTLELVEPCFRLTTDHSKVVTLLGSLSSKLKDIQAMQNNRVYTNRSDDMNYLKISQGKSRRRK